MSESLANLSKDNSVRVPSLSAYKDAGTELYVSTSYGDISNLSFTATKDARWAIMLYTNLSSTPQATVKINGYEFDSLYVGGVTSGTIYKFIKADVKKGDVVTFAQGVRSGQSAQSYIRIVEHTN